MAGRLIPDDLRRRISAELWPVHEAEGFGPSHAGHWTARAAYDLPGPPDNPRLTAAVGCVNEDAIGAIPPGHLLLLGWSGSAGAATYQIQVAVADRPWSHFPGPGGTTVRIPGVYPPEAI